MSSALYEAIGLLVMFLFLGIAWALIDTKVGIPLRRWAYRMTHKDPLPPEDRRGIIIRQSSRRKFTVAGFISLVQSAYVLVKGEDVNFLSELVMWVFESGFMVAGFYCVTPFIKAGDFLLDKVAARLDEVERKETTIGKIAGEVAGDVTHRAASVTSDAFKGVSAHVSEHVGEVVEKARRLIPEKKDLEPATVDTIEETVTTPVEPEPIRPDPRNVLKKFTGGKHDGEENS